MLKILNLDPDNYSEKAASILSEYGVIDNFNDKFYLEEIIKDYDVLLLRFAKKIDQELLDKAIKLKIIACNATGVDHIDTQYAAKLGIKILSLKGEYNFLDEIHATAELTWGLILSLVREIPHAVTSVAKGEWDRDRFLANELYGKRIGILGYGRIGKKIARYANCFGLQVYTYDTTKKEYEGYVTSVESIEVLCNVAEILTIHIPYDEKNHHLINHSLIKLMPRGAYIINTSRGAIIDEVDLVCNLKGNHIAGVAVDVLEGEPESNFLNENMLYQYSKKNQNVIITPHIGGVTKESWEKTECFIAQKVIDYIHSEEIKGRIAHEYSN